MRHWKQDETVPPEATSRPAGSRATQSLGPTAAPNRHVNGHGVRVGVVGCGYWGAKHVRVLSGIDAVSQIAVIDPDPASRDQLLTAFPACRPYQDLASALPEIDALVIATPPCSHAELGLQALRQGKHILVEKPLATSLADARLLVDEAAAQDCWLMVGHTFEFNPAVRELSRRMRRDELGEIRYIHSARLNLGLYRTDVNVVWDLAPHDISILNFLLRSRPVAVTAWSSRNASLSVEDLAYIRLDYREPSVAAYVHVSWLDPKKVRKVTVVGSRKMAVYNDLDEERLRIFDRGVDGAADAAPNYERPFSYRNGDIVSPHIRFDEPLATEDRHFVDSIRNGTPPETDGWAGLVVVAVLEAIDQSLVSGTTITVAYPNALEAEAPRLAEVAP